MNRIPVQSSNIRSLGWENGTLEVEFSRGDVYHYEGVPRQAFEEVVGAVSVGRAFHQKVERAGFPYRREGEE
jgi:hypothetical protein